MTEKITNEEWQENKRKVQEAFREIEEETIRKMPLWMRMNFYCNRLSRAIKDGHTDDEIKWDYINDMCTKDLSEFDYNMYEPVTTFEEFQKQRFDVICATEGVGSWHKHICKDCGNEFHMLHNEVMFYQDKELNLPKRCKTCREKRKRSIGK